jgi:FkbM family methyltransferase
VLNLSTIPRENVLGYLLRLPLAIIPQSAVVRIVQGPLRGCRWVAGSGPHGLWLGTYEAAKQKRVIQIIKKGDTVFDIGANAGIYTLLFSEYVGEEGKVHAFEPLPENVTYLRRHVGINRLQNVSIHALAVASRSGKVRFAHTHSRFTSHIDVDGDLEVDTIALDDFVSKGGVTAPSVMKIDVEGGERAVLDGARQLLATAPPVIFLATHGKEAHTACCDLLRSFGYRLEGINGEAIDNTDELLCIPPRV